MIAAGSDGAQSPTGGMRLTPREAVEIIDQAMNINPA